MSDTRAKVIKLRKFNPCMAGAEIARRVGLSRERVRQILGDNNSHYIQDYNCYNCGITLTRNQVNKGYIFCSQECRHQYYQIPIVCDVCGNIFYLSKSDLLKRLGYYCNNRIRKVDKLFCSKECYGRWWGRKYGGHKPANLETIRDCAIIK